MSWYTVNGSFLSLKFQAILQYRNIRTGEYFAQSAHDSAKVMEMIAVKTKQETVSMHSITILTLVFLPGTFLAVSCLPASSSLLSSTVCSLEANGDWKTNNLSNYQPKLFLLTDYTPSPDFMAHSYHLASATDRIRERPFAMG